MTIEDHRSQAQLLARALDQSCEYAQQLWNDLAAMRQYLHDSLPPEPGGHGPVGASPSSPEDDAGWQRWIDAYAAITTDLCGPHGDSGYGRQSGETLARSRRRVVVPTLEPDADSTPTRLSSEAQRAPSDAGGTRDVGSAPTDDGVRVAATGDGQSSRDRTGPLGTQPAAAKKAVAPVTYGALGSALTVLALRVWRRVWRRSARRTTSP